MSYLYTIFLCIVGLLVTIVNQVSSWMAWGETIEWFEVLVVGAMWGGRWGCECRSRVDCEAMCGL